MKVLVAIKRVMDYATHIRLKADKSGVETTNSKMAMNPFDEIAVEEAVRLKEKGIVNDIVVVSIGNVACQETIRSALARGADRGIWIEANEAMQPLAIAKILKALAERESPQLIILGKQAVDDDNNQTGQMLAGLLNWPQATFASKLEIETNKARVTREIDGGLETILLTLPAVVTTDLRLNEPRYLSLPNIVQAKNKPIASVSIAELNINTQSKQKIVQVQQPEKHRAGIMVNSVVELLDKLRNEARVIA